MDKKLATIFLQRILRLIATILLASTILFILLRIIPGDPAQIILGIDGSSNEELLAKIRKDFGLDKTLLLQYADWLRSTITLQFGNSWQRAIPVNQLVLERLGLTLTLAFSAMTLSLLISIPLGILTALKQNQAIDGIIMGSANLLLALPEFWVGILLLLAFAVFIPIFPIFGSGSPLHLVLPVLALGLGRSAFLLRMVRGAVLIELRKDYYSFFTVLEIPKKRILFRHILPNAIIPIAIPAGIQFGYLLGGAIIIEQVFSMGGTGRLLFTAIQARDFPLIQGIVILLAIIFSLVNFSADIFVAIANPQSRGI